MFVSPFCNPYLDSVLTSNSFVYGGVDAGFTESYDDLYVLSLPGFVWFRADDRSNGVHSHGTCAVVGKR